MSKLGIAIPRSQIWFLIILALLIVQSCKTVRLISDYDEITDKAVTAMQEKVSKFFVKMDGDIGTDKAKYTNNKDFYDSIKVDLNTLKVRADAIDKNTIVQQQIINLTSMVDNTEKLHKIGFKTTSELKPLVGNFNTSFTAIIKLQLALKRGETNK